MQSERRVLSDDTLARLRGDGDGDDAADATPADLPPLLTSSAAPGFEDPIHPPFPFTRILAITRGFPTFSGDAKLAYDRFTNTLGLGDEPAKKLSILNAAKVREAKLRLRDDSPAVELIFQELLYWVDLKEQVDWYFDVHMRGFIQDLFINNLFLLDRISNFLQLEGAQETSFSLRSFLIDTLAFMSSSYTLGSQLGAPSKALAVDATKYLFFEVLKDRGGGVINPNDQLKLTVAALSESLRQQFNASLNEVGKLKELIFTHLGRLKAMVRIDWPDADSERILRDETVRGFERRMWKQLLPTRTQIRASFLENESFDSESQARAYAEAQLRTRRATDPALVTISVVRDETTIFPRRRRFDGWYLALAGADKDAFSQDAAQRIFSFFKPEDVLYRLSLPLIFPGISRHSDQIERISKGGGLYEGRWDAVSKEEPTP